MKKRVLALAFVINWTVFLSACGNSVTPVINEEQGETSSFDAVSKEDAESEEDTASQDNNLEENAAVNDASEQSMPDDAAETKDEDAVAKEEKVPAWNTAVKLSDDLYDFQISIDGTVYQFPMWYSDFEALGWEYSGDNTDTLSSNQYAGTQCWKKDDFSVYTILGNLSMNTTAFSDCMVAGISMDKNEFKDCEWEILLPGGIQWGVSNADDIKAAYGDPTSDYDGSDYYEMKYRYDYYREIKLYVYKDSGVLEEIRIENLIALEDG